MTIAIPIANEQNQPHRMPRTRALPAKKQSPPNAASAAAIARDMQMDRNVSEVLEKIKEIGMKTT
jgi:hypothetical protein